MTRLRVLIVEDDRDVARVTRGFVEHHGGFTVAAEVATGRAALDALVSVRPDLVLLDIHLPDMTGIAVLRTARAHGYAGEVIPVTAASELETVRRARQLGVRHYLVKPFTMRAMHERLDAVHAAILDERRAAGIPLDQRGIDSLLRDSPGKPAAPSEGSSLTLRRVADALERAADGASAVQIAADTGLSRVSARRYLQQLVESGRALVEPRYGVAGRPELRYRPADAPSGIRSTGD